MLAERDYPPDDPASAPESGTNRDDTSGNLPAAPQERPVQLDLILAKRVPGMTSQWPGKSGERSFSGWLVQSECGDRAGQPAGPTKRVLGAGLVMR